MSAIMLNLFNRLTRLPTLVRFSIVGLSGTLLDFSLLIILKSTLFLPTIPANAISFSVGILNNYTLNRRWTFPDAHEKSISKQFLQFTLVSVFGLILNTGVVMLLEDTFNHIMFFSNTGYIPSKIIATGFVLLWNFTANSLWTFNKHF